MGLPLGLRPAHELAALIRSRELSSRELLDHYLDRIATLNPDLNAVVTVAAEQAQVRAAELDELAARGTFVGPLHGLPVTVKDSLATAGIRTTNGTAHFARHVPVRDATVVSRIKDAGAVVLGKTNVPAWCRDIQTDNQLFGTTNNPWDLTRTPGGSSGGSATAVAAGLTSFELGSDIAGSLRIPASFCGIFSHKPSYGIVPQQGCIDRLDGGTSHADLNVLGPLARSARDLELVLSLITGPDEHAARAWQLTLPAPAHRELREFRVGVWLDEDALELDHAVNGVLRAAIDRLSDGGAHVEFAKPDLDFFSGVELYHSLVLAAASVCLPETAAPGLTQRRWLDLDHERRRFIGQWDDWFDKFDVLLCPVLPIAAFAHDHRAQAERTLEINGAEYPLVFATAWTGLIGAAYLPATVVPVGHTDAGLPVGIQVVARRYCDTTSLRVAVAIEEVLASYAAPSLAGGYRASKIGRA